MKRIDNWSAPKRIEQTITECNCPTPESCRKLEACVARLYNHTHSDFWDGYVWGVGWGLGLATGVGAIAAFLRWLGLV